MLLTVRGRLLACGLNRHGALGLGDTLSRLHPTQVPLPPGTRVVQVQCGALHTLAILHEAGRSQVHVTGMLLPCRLAGLPVQSLTKLCTWVALCQLVALLDCCIYMLCNGQLQYMASPQLT